MLSVVVDWAKDMVSSGAVLLAPTVLVPLNAAVMVWAPTEENGTVRVAVPVVGPPSTSTVVRRSAPSKKVTPSPPVTFPPPALTMAVKVTGWPTTAGLAEKVRVVAEGSRWLGTHAANGAKEQCEAKKYHIR